MADTKSERPLRIGIYARQSVPEEQGIRQQIAEVRGDLERRGWLGWIVEEYPDDDTSGTATRGSATHWARMLRDIDGGRIDTVAVVAPDRLTRNLGDLPELRAPRREVRIVTARGGIDTGDPYGEFFLAQMVLMAEQEIRQKTARVVPYRDARHAKGIPTPGRVPYGYRWIPKSEREARGLGERRFEVVEAEAEVVRFIFREALGMLGNPVGIEVGSIVREVNAKGWRTRPTKSHPEGGPWRSSTVRRMLLSPYYAAMLPPIDSLADRPLTADGKPAYWRAERIDLDSCIPGDWEPIRKASGEPLTLDDVRAVRHALISPEAIKRRRTNGGKVSRKWLLSGLARCGAALDEGDGEAARVCGERVRSAWTREGLRGYRCPAGHFLRRAEVLDDWAVETVLERLTRPDAASLLRPAPEVDIPALQAAAQALDARRAELTKWVSSGRRTFAQVADLDDELADQLARVEVALAEAYRADPIAEALGAEDVRAHWEGLTLPRQRTILASLFEPIILPVGKGWRVVDIEPRGRQLHVSATVHAAWRRNVEGKGGTWEHPLGEDGRRAIAAA